jgi:uncharacterized protein (TIGR03086 family)
MERQTDDMDVTELHRRAVGEFSARLDAVGASGSSTTWSAPTPCSDWDVRALINHITYEDRWTAPILKGATIAEIGDRFEGDLLGDDPVGAFAAASAEATSESAHTDPATIVHLSFGDVPAGEYLYQLSADHLIHGWDLAAATDGDRHFDEEVVRALADWFADRESMYRDGGFIGPRVSASSDDPQDRLLAAFGRDPAWRPR